MTGNRGVVPPSPSPATKASHRRYAADTAEQLAAESSRAEALARSNEELQLFARVVAHDLQEPLRSILADTKLALSLVHGRLDGRLKKFLLRVDDCAWRMSQLIPGLLSYARIDTQGLPFEATDSAMALAGAAANLKASIDESQALITHDSLPVVEADPTQLILLLQNLLANAIRYRRSDRPFIHVGARRKGDEWVFSVKDDGRGFDQGAATHLFNLFDRSDPGRPGRGLGLAICKKIIARHGGRLWAVSKPGAGATFYFSLPILRREAASGPNEAHQGDRIAGGTGP